MGGGSYSDDFYNDRVASRAATGAPVFTHDAAIRSGKTHTGVHDSLNIRNKVRESRDSAEHPNSTPVAVIFDVTGSMAGVPVVMQTKLPQLMGLLLRKNYVEDPQILFGAVGDAIADEVPLQIGQFESDIRMDDNITNIFLEGGGGGSFHESYQNALYYFAHKTICDAFEKRGKKGFLFLIGDELAYNKSTKEELTSLIGDGIQSDVSFDAIVAAAKEKWEVFFIIPKGTSHFGSAELSSFWKKHLGQNVIMLEDPAAVCETIGLTIGLFEGTTDADGMAKDLKDVGTKDTVARVATSSVGAIAKDRALARVGQGGTLPAKKGPSSNVERL